MGRVEVDGVAPEYEVTGTGPPVVLLHGFPDTGRLWRHQVPALAEAGFQVVAPDLRGYGRSDKPADVEAYSLAAGRGRRGGLGRPRHRQGPRGRPRLGRGAGLGAGLTGARQRRPPGRVVGRPPGHLPPQPEQREKSWYMLLFQFPGIAERWLTETTGPTSATWAHHPDADA